ncbi:MAG: hypothetical protein RLZZ387_5203 [Chloroflexota bacterium]|jgi:hypothetical protein
MKKTNARKRAAGDTRQEIGPDVVTDRGSSSDVGGTADVRGGSLGDRDLSGAGYSEADLQADVAGSGADLGDIVDADTMVGPGSGVGRTGATPVSYGNTDTRGAGTTGHGLGPSVDIVDLGPGDATLDPTADPRTSPEGIRAPEDDPDKKRR